MNEVEYHGCWIRINLWKKPSVLELPVVPLPLLTKERSCSKAEKPLNFINGCSLIPEDKCIDLILPQRSPSPIALIAIIVVCLVMVYFHRWI